MVDGLKEFVSLIAGLIVMVVGIVGIVVFWATMWAIPTLLLLWNWLMPELFNIPEITIWEAIGVNLLSTILFKSKNQNNENDKE